MSDLRELIHNDLKSGKYECVICLNQMGPQSPLWSCSKCFRAFDLKCVRDWGKRSLVKNGVWSCPFCRTVQDINPNAIKNLCWCGRRHPKKNSLIPHSCSLKCNAPRECIHPCPLKCHAGPHESSLNCTKMGPKIKCFCGKVSEQVICSKTRYNQFSCELKCNHIDKVCKHVCERTCHKRNPKFGCGKCKQKVQVSCHCKKLQNTLVTCSSLSNFERKNLNSLVSCKKTCNLPLNCGHHKCEQICGHKTDHECTLMPTLNETCFCGFRKTNRKSCLEPIESCKQVCLKMMPCGHRCRKVCHPGKCGPCLVEIHNLRCFCTQSIVSAKCFEYQLQKVFCTKKCSTLLNCRRHRCQRECCEFSIPPRVKKTETTLSLNDLINGVSLETEVSSEERAYQEAVEAAHLCTSVCGRLLECGAHTCTKLCHPGKCSPCQQTSFDEWRCSCGKTYLDPPIRCGTLMPSCRFPCTRVRACGHSAKHFCHEDDVPCDLCREQIVYKCKCSKSTLKVPCFDTSNAEKRISEFNCLTVCGKKLPCGHLCQRQCCDECPPCTSKCGIANEVCGHQHMEVCHYPSPCPSECNADLVAQCHCRVLKLKYSCGEDMEINCNQRCIDEHYNEFLMNAFTEDRAWMMNLETEIRQFVRKRDRKTLRLKPMSTKNRQRVYMLIEHYKLDGVSVDEGANRSVCVYLTKDCWMPQCTLKNAPRRDPQTGIDESALAVRYVMPNKTETETEVNE